MIPYFSHLPNQSCIIYARPRSIPLDSSERTVPFVNVSSPETLTHQSAKSLLASTTAVTVHIPFSCGHLVYDSLHLKFPPHKAFSEYRVGSFVHDVVVFKDSVPFLAIEFVVTHRSGAVKLHDSSLPFIEVLALDYLHNQSLLHPVSYSRSFQSVFMPSRSCSVCLRRDIHEFIAANYDKPLGIHQVKLDSLVDFYLSSGGDLDSFKSDYRTLVASCFSSPSGRSLASSSSRSSSPPRGSRSFQRERVLGRL